MKGTDMDQNFVKRIRNADLLKKVMTADEAAAFIKPGMTLGISGFTVGNPKSIGGALAKRAEAGEKLDLTVLSGASTGDEFDGVLARAGAIRRRYPYQTNNDLRNAINAGKVSYFDITLSQVPQWIKSNFFGKIDVAVVEATAIDENGNIIPSTSIGISNVCVECADKVIVEVNTAMPEELEGLHDIYSPKKAPNTEPIPVVSVDHRVGTTYIPCDPEKIVAVVHTNMRDTGRPVAEPDDEFRQMAKNLVNFLKDEVKAGRLCDPLPPLQAGVGSVSNAVLDGLRESDFENLTVYSEVLQNSVFDLIEEGKVVYASGTSLTISSDKQDEFFEKLPIYRDKIILRPQEISNHPEVIRRLGTIAINTVIEADIYGNTNSSYVDGVRLMNGVGGSGDFCQNAGLSLFITKSTAKNGTLSSIVPLVSRVDHTIHEIHALVTEQGVADLRGLDPVERANAIIDNCAHPKFRKALHEYFDNAMAACKYKGNPVDINAAVNFDKVSK